MIFYYRADVFISLSPPDEFILQVPKQEGRRIQISLPPGTDRRLADDLRPRALRIENFLRRYFLILGVRFFFYPFSLASPAASQIRCSSCLLRTPDLIVSSTRSLKGEVLTGFEDVKALPLPPSGLRIS